MYFDTPVSVAKHWSHFWARNSSANYERPLNPGERGRRRKSIYSQSIKRRICNYSHWLGSRPVMAGGALMFKAPVALGWTRTRAGPTTTTASLPSPEQSPSSCSKSNKSRGEKIGFGNAVVSRRWVALVLPVAATLLSIPPLPVSAGDGRQGCKVELRTLNGCGLGVSRYPDFVYNAEGGGGFGSAEKLLDGRWHVHFNASEVTIPAVGYKTTTLLGAPLPPPLRIDVVPDTLDGMVDRESGKVELTFQAKFFFSAGPVYRPPPLIVDTLLTTESTQGEFRGGQGSRLDSQGNCRLVGVARLAPIDDIFMSTFLSLPSECLANMSANFSFTS